MRMEQKDESLVPRLERATLCMGCPEHGATIQKGDHGFTESLQQYYSATESDALERLVQLKRRLRHASKPDFWKTLIHDMTAMTAAQYGFVSKRIESDQETAAEMPPIGEPGSCLLGVVFYWNDGGELQNLARDYKYWAQGAPCGGMRNDKVYLLPNGLPKLFPSNPNVLPFPAEAYIGIPLFAGGKCFGHFGMMWDKKGLQRLTMSWAFVESILHSLEDIILERLLDRRFGDPESLADNEVEVNVSDLAKTAQSLKPFARNLSHELRTPMQGVVGMLDVMHANVQEFLEECNESNVRNLLSVLREDIEVVQDSSRRAVEAADNVVHAYDLDMQIPDTPVAQNDDESSDEQRTVSADNPHDSHSFPMEPSAELRGTKRRRISDSIEGGLSTQRSQISNRDESPYISVVENITENAESTMEVPGSDSVPTPGLRQAKLRDLLHLLINESLRVGGRPESAFAQDKDGGETIEVTNRGADGRLKSKIIDWSVDPDVPEAIMVDEKDLTKLISCVFLNAIKFTEEGVVALKASVSPKAKFIVIQVTDTGPGIPQDFLPFLFKPFSREDDSLTRHKEGLGLGLLVAKGLVRKVGGDLVCTRSETSGPGRGSEFELRIPLTLGESTSRASSPNRTPTPGHVSQSEPPARRNSKFDPLKFTQPSQISPSKEPPKPSRASSPPSQKQAFVEAQKGPSRRSSIRQAPSFDRGLAQRYPLNFLVAEDNTLNRKLLVKMLRKLGYSDILEAFDGQDAVNQMAVDRTAEGRRPIDVVLMDLWMPNMDGYEASERIFAMERKRLYEVNATGHGNGSSKKNVTILAVTADVTDSALERASAVGMAGYLTKPYELLDLEKKILEYCTGGGMLEMV